MKIIAVVAVTTLVAVVLGEHCPDCVYTQGYWTTHGPNGPAPYDPTFDKVTDTLCGHDYSAVLNNAQCQQIGNQFWCANARQLVAIEMNLLSDDCDAAHGLGFNATLFAAYNAAHTALCAGNPMQYPQNSQWTELFTAYNEGRFPGGPCHCGDPGCDDAPEDPEPECRLVCKCDVTNGNGGNGECDQFCTLTQGYWKNHPEDWDQSQWQICGEFYLDIWAQQSTPQTNTWLNLARQYMAAALNIDSAPVESCVDPEIIAIALQGFQILEANCDKMITDPVEAQTAEEVKTLLDAFNNGNIGPGHCVDGPLSGPENGGNSTSGGPQCINCEPVLDCCPPLPTPPPSNNLGCTLTQGYWKNHPENWPLPLDSEWCGELWTDILATPPAGNAWYQLAHQAIAALLNQASGAFVPADVQQELDVAVALLLDNCGEFVNAQHPDHAQMIALNEALTAYNEGDRGVPHCGSASHLNNTCPAVCPPQPPHSCTGGCTRTQGYWKNHELQWPQQWVGASLCGELWIDLFHTPPSGGDAKLILAHQYFAAVLNVASGACLTPEVEAALETAHQLLMACDDSLFAKKTQTRAQAIEVAVILDAYNNGQLGPGHCDFVQQQQQRRRSALSGTSEGALARLVAEESLEDGVELVVAGTAQPASASDAHLDRLTAAVNGLHCPSVSTASLEGKINALQCPSVSTSSLEAKINQLGHQVQQLGGSQQLVSEIRVLMGEVEELGRRRCPDCNCTADCSSSGKYDKQTRDMVIALLAITGATLLLLLAWWLYAMFGMQVVFARRV